MIQCQYLKNSWGDELRDGMFEPHGQNIALRRENVLDFPNPFLIDSYPSEFYEVVLSYLEGRSKLYG